MKIVSWNCNGALRNKMTRIDSLDADILVIQECEDPAGSTKAYREWAGKYLWTGKNRHRGLGIFARNGHSIDPLDWRGSYRVKEFSSNSAALSWNSDDLHSFLPCSVNSNLTLLGIWTKNTNAKHFRYIGQLWKYIQIHRARLRSGNLIMCGDLNSNAIWDAVDRWWNHSDVVWELEEIGVHSLYHHINEESQGLETKKTYFMHRNRDKSYHIDYAFASEPLIPKCSLKIADINTWIDINDHVPITVEFTI
jgi:exonuclease III